MGESYVVNSAYSLASFKTFVDALVEKSGYVEFTYTTAQKRTKKQNKALHKFCELIAKSCNLAGYEFVLTSPVLKSPVDVPWTMESVKEHVWRPIQIAHYPDKKSTADLDKTEISEIADVISRYLAESKGILVVFPNKDWAANDD